MGSELDVYARIQQHLQHGHGAVHTNRLERLDDADDTTSQLPLPRQPAYLDDDDHSTTHLDPDEDFDAADFYALKNVSEYNSSTSLHEPTYLLPVTTTRQDPAGMAEKKSLMHSNTQGWETSRTDLPLKHDAIDNDADETHTWSTNPIYPRRVASSQTHLVPGQGLADESFEMPSSKEGRFTWSNRDKLERKVRERERGIGRQKYPFITWFISFAIVAVFIAELIVSKQRTGEAVQIHPTVQPMLGPPAEFLISFGARFVPCMRSVPGLPTTNMIPCLSETTSEENRYTRDQMCSIAHVCGLERSEEPNQGYRFVSAIFIHAGFVHILFNLIVLLTLCGQIEKLIGSIAYTIVFMAGGIGGNLLGGNFGLIGQPALGASGAVYTCISFEMIDLIYNWRFERKPITRLTVSIVFAIIGLALGLLPGLDNFSHIGGFCVGILGGLIFAPSIHPSRLHMIVNWICRMVGLGLLVAFLVALVLNFYRSEDPARACTWCRYLSCLPVFDACKGYGISTTTPDGRVTE